MGIIYLEVGGGRGGRGEGKAIWVCQVEKNPSHYKKGMCHCSAMWH